MRLTRLLIAATRFDTHFNVIRKHQFSTTTIRHKVFGQPDPEGRPPPRKNFKDSLLPLEWYDLIDRYPDFMPDPINHNPLLVSRQIDDMLKRRSVIEIPTFYVGTIMSVTCSDQYSETKRRKFMGICIDRRGQLLYSNFTLRNVIDGMGIEIRYDMYNPLILSIEVLRLEKRLDDELLYLRDALPEYSTFPEDMKPEILSESAEVPVNKTLVKMKPMPWSKRWERHFYKGIEKLENIPQIWAERAQVIADSPRNLYDTMLEYRRHCTEEQLYNICKRLAEHERDVVIPRAEARRKRFLNVARKPIAQTTKTTDKVDQ